MGQEFEELAAKLAREQVMGNISIKATRTEDLSKEEKAIHAMAELVGGAVAKTDKGYYVAAKQGVSEESIDRSFAAFNKIADPKTREEGIGDLEKQILSRPTLEEVSRQLTIERLMTLGRSGNLTPGQTDLAPEQTRLSPKQVGLINNLTASLQTSNYEMAAEAANLLSKQLPEGCDPKLILAIQTIAKPRRDLDKVIDYIEQNPQNLTHKHVEGESPDIPPPIKVMDALLKEGLGSKFIGGEVDAISNETIQAANDRYKSEGVSFKTAGTNGKYPKCQISAAAANDVAFQDMIKAKLSQKLYDVDKTKAQVQTQAPEKEKTEFVIRKMQGRLGSIVEQLMEKAKDNDAVRTHSDKKKEKPEQKPTHWHN